jgi:hypothetical protein
MVFRMVSMSIRLSRAAFNPNSAGNWLPGTVGVSKVPETGLPSVFNSATGSTQLWVHFSPPCPTPRTVRGRSRRFCSGRRPARRAMAACCRTHSSPARFLIEPMSSNIAGFPLGSLVSTWYTVGLGTWLSTCRSPAGP